MADHKKPKKNSVRDLIKSMFSGATVAPGSGSNKLLEGVADKIQEALGRKLKKKKE